MRLLYEFSEPPCEGHGGYAGSTYMGCYTEGEFEGGVMGTDNRDRVQFTHSIMAFELKALHRAFACIHSTAEDNHHTC